MKQDNKNLKCITDDEDLFNQQTLDHLLESLAIESDTTEKYLSELDENENFEINEISEDIDNLENLEIPSRSTITTLTTANRSFNNNGNEISISNVPADGLLITVNNHASINKESYNININHNYNIVSNKKRPFTTATIKSPSLAPRNNGCFWDQVFLAFWRTFITFSWLFLIIAKLASYF